MEEESHFWLPYEIDAYIHILMKLNGSQWPKGELEKRLQGISDALGKRTFEFGIDKGIIVDWGNEWKVDISYAVDDTPKLIDLEEGFELQRILDYIHVLSLFDEAEMTLKEFKEAVKKMMGDEFAEELIEFGEFTGAIYFESNKIKITNEYDTVEYGRAKITYRWG